MRTIKEDYPDAPPNVMEVLMAADMFWRFERLVQFAQNRWDELTEPQIELAIMYLQQKVRSDGNKDGD